MAKSPSINLIERDVLSYSTVSSNTTIAVVGYATKGPIGNATTVSSFKEFRQKFGYPTALGFSSLAVQRAFNQGNSLIFYRVAEVEGDEAATPSTVLVKNNVDALNSYVEFSRTTDILKGAANYVNGIEYSFDLSGKNIYMKSPSSGRWPLNDMLDQISNQLPVTSGYQEFTDKNLSNASYTSYMFKLTMDGAVVGGAVNNTLMVDIASSDTLSSVCTKISNAVHGGSRSYSTIGFTASKSTLTTALSLSATKYNFKIRTIAEGTWSTVVIYNVTTNSTLKDIASKINTELTRRNISVVCLPATTGLYFFNKTYGVNSYVEIHEGEDLTSSSMGVDLFRVNDSFEGTIAATVVGTVTTAASGVTVAIDSYTNRIKITSSTTGASSSVLLASPTLNSVLPGHDLTVVLGTKDARNGQGASTATVEKNATSLKIRVSSDSSAALSDFIDNGTIGEDFLTLMPVDTAVTGYGGTSTDNTDVIVFASKETGDSTNRISIEKSSTVNPVTALTTHTIKIYYDGELKETFADVSLTLADDTYFVNVINESIENGGSEWVSVTAYDNNDDSVITFPNGTYQLGTAADSTSVEFDSVTMTEDEFEAYDYSVGTNGIPENGGEGLFVDAFNSSSDLANKDLYDYHILVTPDNNEEAVQTAAISLAESRKDFLYLIDPPFGLSYDQVKAWHNGDGYGRYTAVSSSYAAVYWPWLKDYDSYNKKYVWCPPSVFVGEKLLEVDRVYKPWAAPAGETRGKIIANDSEFSPSFAEREELYGDFNCVNPIVDFSSKGLIIYGQKTSSREDIASNRINVRRMVIYVKKLIKKSLDAMLFEPNNQTSWQRATSLINSILETVRQTGGISNYLVTIDATTNTADVQTQDMMTGTVKIVPTGTIEIVELNINVYKSGSTIE